MGRKVKNIQPAPFTVRPPEKTKFLAHQLATLRSLKSGKTVTINDITVEALQKEIDNSLSKKEQDYLLNLGSGSNG